MAVLRNGQWKAPLWGAEKTFITGQDMLGMQNTSIATYSVLVPGLTNLTRRVRYYGFYTWVLEQYARHVGKDSTTEFRKYVRRAELLMAYMMADKFPDVRGVVGSQFAKNHLADFPEAIDLAEGADQADKKKTYWKGSSGAFGQYYQGTLVAMNLVTASQHNSNLFIATPELGRSLSGHFEESISTPKRESFLSAVTAGIIDRDTLYDIAGEFCITDIPVGAERSFYRELFMGPDFPYDTGKAHRYFRKETILLYLSYLNDAGFSKYTNFWDTFYTTAWDKHPLENCESARGWFYFSVNESTHYCLETFLWHMLKRLQDGSATLPNMLEQLSQEVLDSAIKITANDAIRAMSFRQFADEVYNENEYPFDDLGEIRKDGKDAIHIAAAKALLGMCRVYLHIQAEFEELVTYSRHHLMARGEDCLALYAWIHKHETLLLPEFFKKLLLQNVVNRHLEVAMKKMRNRNENTLKFIFEDNQLSLVSVFPPVFTGPRIASLRYFLKDMGYLVGEDDNTTLTPDGIQLLEAGIDG